MSQLINAGQCRPPPDRAGAAAETPCRGLPAASHCPPQPGLPERFRPLAPWPLGFVYLELLCLREIHFLPEPVVAQVSCAAPDKPQSFCRLAVDIKAVAA